MLPLKGKETMTAGGKKRWMSLMLRSFGAVFLGWCVVSAFVVLLTLYGTSPDVVPVTTARSSLKFPENEQMLNAAAAQLARDGATLSKVEPAAGVPKKSK